MNVTTLCAVCGGEGASDRCDQCGSMVCRRHYDTDRGICTECAASFWPDRESDEESIDR
ncbi:MAG: hypothetical protein ABEJ08_05960 [Halobacteriaceae archaeon]